MTAAVSAIEATDSNARRDAIADLARTEARRALLGLPFWLGLAITIWFGAETTGLDWQGATYAAFPTAFGALAAGIFVAGVLAGGRDHRGDNRLPLAEEAALDGTARTVARILSLVPLVLIGAVLVVAVAVGIRIEGGHWVGDHPGRTDIAVHSPAEVLQPILLLAIAAIAGVAAGRTFRRRSPVIVVGLLVWFLLIGAYWIWQGVPMVYAVPIQVQPIEVAIAGDATDPATFPGDWLLNDPGDGDGGENGNGEWRRVLVHQPLAIGHDIYLVGLGALAAGVALRGRSGRRLVVAGVLVAGLGLATQVLVMPDGATTVDVPT